MVLQFIEVNDIIRLEAEGRYTNMIFTNHKKELVTKLLGEFDELLNEYQFFRPHKSHLINLDYVSQYLKTDGGVIEMKDGSRIPLSKSKKEQFLEQISHRVKLF
jgi:two-component system LytT family response regulator